MVALLSYLPQYCERSVPGLWGEPVNTVSNLAFFLAAWGLVRSPAWPGTATARLIISLLVAIGVGSTLWHLTAWRWTLWADVLPIAAFMGVFAWVFLRQVAGLGRGRALAVFAAFVAVEGVLAWVMPPHLLNGVGFYLPAVAFVAGMAAWLALQGRAAGGFAAAAGLLLLAIAARLLDFAICPFWPIGSHFLWHLGAAAALFLLIQESFKTQRHPSPLGGAEGKGANDPGG